MTTIHLTLLVDRGYLPGTWQVIDTNYEPKYPMGLGNSIPEALDAYLEEAEYFYCEKGGNPYDSFTWNWKGQA